MENNEVLNMIIVLEKNLVEELNNCLYSTKNDIIFEYYFDMFSDIQDVIREIHEYLNGKNRKEKEYNVNEMIKMCQKI